MFPLIRFFAEGRLIYSFRARDFRRLHATPKKVQIWLKGTEDPINFEGFTADQITAAMAEFQQSGGNTTFIDVVQGAEAPSHRSHPETLS